MAGCARVDPSHTLFPGGYETGLDFPVRNRGVSSLKLRLTTFDGGRACQRLDEGQKIDTFKYLRKVMRSS